MNYQSQRGFTLVELITVVSLLAIFASIAVPAFAAFVERNESETLRQQVLANLSQARTQAVIDRSSTRLCGSADGVQCDGAWSKGMLIVAASSDRASYTPFASRQTLQWRGAKSTDELIYLSNGTTRMSNGRFVSCSTDAKVTWQIVISLQGRPRMVTGLERDQSHTALCG